MPPVTRRRPVAVGLSALLLIGVAACSSSGGDADDDSTPSARPSASGPLGAYYGQTLRWKGCGDGLSCTTLRVPIDYGNPSSGDLKLAVVRRKATDRNHRIGSLLVNPGGPGGSGVDYARQPGIVTDPVGARFDVVGFDPRGVGESDPVECLDDKRLDTFLAADGSPDNPAEVQALDAQAKLLVNGCRAHSEKLLPHVGTADAARDMDVLRAALGDRELYYLGKSYGTYLGATYADLFPKQVGRVVLDGAVDPRTNATEAARTQAVGFETALRAFVTDCVKRSDCPLGRDVAGGLNKIDDLFATTDERPLPGDDGRELTQSLAVLGVAASMYDAQYWVYLRQALELAFNGNGAGLLTLADAYAERDQDGHYANNQNEVIYAVNCLDRPDVHSTQEISAELPSFRKVSPRFGDYIAWGELPCAHWPVSPVNKPHAITAPGSKPILVVGTIRDPATPYVWAQGLAQQLSAGTLLTYDGDGHTAYTQGSSCIDDKVDRYLLEGKPPAEGTRCK